MRTIRQLALILIGVFVLDHFPSLSYYVACITVGLTAAVVERVVWR